MTKSKRKRKARPAPGTPRPPRKPAAEREAEARAELVPLAEGERPTALKVGAIIAGLAGLANLVLFAAGYEVRGRDPSLGGTLATVAVLLAASAGMWLRRYWALLGFQALLAITALFAGLGLAVASNLYGAAFCLALLGGSSFLFYRLIRVMARLQMPQR